MRRINRKAKKRVISLMFLFVFFLSSQVFISSSPVFASVEERDISVEWGDNVFQNLPYNYYGTFYENTDPTDAWDTAKLEFTYIPDTTINDEYTITQDFTNYEGVSASGEQNFTFNEGSGSDYDNLQSNDNNYASFNYTGVGHYNATYSFEEELDGTTRDFIDFIDFDGSASNCEASIISSFEGHRKVLQLYDNNGAGNVAIYHDLDSEETDLTVEFWWASDNVATGWTLIEFHEGVNIRLRFLFDSGAWKYHNGVGWQTPTSGAVVNTWYHHRITLDDTTNIFDWWIDGVSVGAGLDYNSNTAIGIDRFFIQSESGGANYNIYIDAWDELWDPSYDEGRNREDLSVLGHFPATYSFDDQPVWTSGTAIDFVNSFGGTASDKTLKIESPLYSHSKILNLSCSDGINSANFIHTFSGDITGGIIEWWQYCSGGTAYTRIYGDGPTEILRVFVENTVGRIAHGDGVGGVENSDLVIPTNTFIHFRLDINFTSDTFDGYINDVLVEDDGTFMYDYIASELMQFYGLIYGNTGSKTSLYIDGFGESWNNGYLIGDNLNDNYFLGYENFESYNLTNDAETELEANNWSINKGGMYNNVSISGEYNSHKKVLNLTDNSNAQTIYATNSFTQQESGTIEYYVKTTDKAQQITLDLKSGTNRAIQLVLGYNWFFYTDLSGTSQYLLVPNNNEWYHLQIDFECGNGGYEGLSADRWHLYINDVKYANLEFRYEQTNVNNYHVATISVHYDYSCYFNALSYSWEDTNTYFKGSYNQHCNVEAVIDFTVDVPFEYYDQFILQVNMDSRHYTNIHTNISWSFYNFTSSSWTELTDYSAIAETLREFDNSDVLIGLSGLFDSSGNMKFRYYGYNHTAFYLEIDELSSNVYFGTVFSYEKTLKLLGTWKYRFKLDVGLGTEHITDWIYFNVVEQPANFEGISESRYSTRWVLTSTATTGELTDVYYDDLTSGYWDLSDYSGRSFTSSQTATEDAKVELNYPTQNYGSSDTAKVGRYYDVSDWIETQRTYFEFGNNPADYYLSENITGNYDFQFWVGDPIYYYSNPTWWVDIKMTSDFDESTLTWNNKPALGSTLTQDFNLGTVYGTLTADLGTSTYSSVHYIAIQEDFLFGTLTDGEINERNIRTSEYVGSWARPKLLLDIYKNYHTTSGEGYAYMQTSSTETLGLISQQLSSDISLTEGDIFTVDLETTSDNALLKLYNDEVLQSTINLLTANTETSRQEVEVIVSEDVSYDQVKITSELDDTEIFKLYDIKAEHWVFESEEDQEIMYVEPFGQNELILNLGNSSLKIYENDILRTDTYITMTYDLTTHIFESPIPETVYVSFYDSNSDYLDFNEFTTYVNYTLFEENFIDQRLTSREFYVDEDSTIYFNVYDSFDVNIYSNSRLAKTFIDITLSVYTLKIKNEALEDSSYTLTKGSVDKTGILFPDEIDEYKISSGSYTFAYIKGADPEESINFDLSGDKLVKINRSQMCFLSYTNQRGDYLNFNQFKTYWNERLLYENVFYEDIGNNVSLEIKDHYDISVKNHSFIVSSGDNYIPISLTRYSLKIKNSQESFNHVNITRDPNYYESGYSWSEWIAPGEIIEFELFGGYYKINLTDDENGSNSYYAYTLNGDDIILISSNNIISSVITNLVNVNTTIGNQITNVQIDLTNQNSAINNSIINIDINLSSVNSSLGNLLTTISLNISNIESNISSLYTFTENNFINLGTNVNNSFISIENNIISINQSISNLVIGVNNELSLINGTISTLITQVDTNLLLMNTSIHTSIFDLDTDISVISSDIASNFILLNNSIDLANNNINDSRIAILNNLALINNTMSTLISQVYSSVYLVNNSIYTAVVDLGTSLSLINNSISGDLTIMLQQNDFLTELYRTTMFSELLNWTNIGYNSSLIESQIDAWDFINNYRNESILIKLRYDEYIENLTLAAQESLTQYLPKDGVEYNLWSVADEEYLDDWKPLPENRTVPFGFYEEEIPEIPDFNAPNTILMIILIVIACIFAIAIIGYLANRYRKKSELYRKSYADKITLEAQTISKFSQGRRIK